ncbi:hypothetical protein DMB66_02265 [Actinoplanes sp. ATCC 53533]|uniref:DUF6348 family protein n=1 Tax=Actinoplanes sp. ATCC 53533 TaxID=1288362 RepID=UPI000F78BAD0|nr:DUF6348 family protein [Actinoplanes sp. ATCC 53533]RSM74253.1 hypothetical protein DMB66_02265 [Actinoplanes sp. ATCC 53533]
MALLRDKLEELAPGFTKGSWVKNGMLFGRHSPWAVMSLPNHTESPEHFDLGFSTRLGESEAGLIIDCISGFGTGPAAFDTVLHIWSETSGACFLEMATGGTGRYATHLRDDDPAAIPGWHTISSGVLGYGPDDASNEVLQAAVLDSQILRALAAELTPDLDRPELNGVKVYLCRTPDSTIAEIRVNGEPAVLASEAMAAHPWPNVAVSAIARFYAVAVHPT